MPGLTEQERQEILSRRQVAPSAQSGLPMEIQSIALGGRAPSVRLGQAKPSAEDVVQSSTRKQLLKKAADQKLQLEQAIGLFQKIYAESDTAVPVIRHPEGTLPLQQASRFVGQKLGLREQQRGTIGSLQARATPALKSLGEVGVLTNQDIERMLKGGFPSDDDTAVSRSAKQQGIISDLQMKLDQVNAVLGSPPSATGQATDPHVSALQQQFPGAKITKVK